MRVTETVSTVSVTAASSVTSAAIRPVWLSRIEPGATPDRASRRINGRRRSPSRRARRSEPPAPGDVICDPDPADRAVVAEGLLELTEDGVDRETDAAREPTEVGRERVDRRRREGRPR